MDRLRVPPAEVARTLPVVMRRGDHRPQVRNHRPVAETGGPTRQAPLERLKGGLRGQLGCLTRKTHAFAKQASTWDAAVTLCWWEHNWLGAHRALREPTDVLSKGGGY